jgi:hypothetical protein
MRLCLAAVWPCWFLALAAQEHPQLARIALTAVDRLLGLDVDRHGMFEGDAESRQTDRSRVPLTVCLRYSKVYPPSSLPDEREIVTSDCG